MVIQIKSRGTWFDLHGMHGIRDILKRRSHRDAYVLCRFYQLPEKLVLVVKH
jgi:hypothetical protein